MPHHDDADTDPSTPEARAALGDPSAGPRITPSKILPVAPAVAPLERPKSGAPTTDPGVAPPSSRGASRPPRGAVPASQSKPPLAAHARTPPMPFTAPKSNDSIDMLLDGITAGGDRPRITAQSRGEASAAYDGEHALLPSQPTPVPEPSVIVARTTQPQTLRIDRAQVAQLAQAAPSPPPASVRPVTRGGEPTVVTPRTQGPRVVIALFSAILVVFGIFLALKTWATREKQKASAADPSASVLINPKEPPPKSWTPNATATATATAIAAPSATTMPAAPTPTSMTTATASPRPSGPKPKATDMGELRPSINH